MDEPVKIGDYVGAPLLGRRDDLREGICVAISPMSVTLLGEYGSYECTRYQAIVVDDEDLPADKRAFVTRWRRHNKGENSG